MFNRLSGRGAPSDAAEPDDTPPVRDQGATEPGTWRDKPAGVREIHHYEVGLKKRKASRSEKGAPSARDRISSYALVAAGLLIACGIVGSAGVVYDAQYKFALAHNWGNDTAAHIQAAVPEVVWLGMALLGLSQALRGRKSARATSGIVLFFSLSMGAQLMYAMPNPGGYLIAIITPLALALLLETFLDGVYRWACARDGISVEERPVLLRVGAALGRVPKLLWVLPAALTVGLLLDFTATWEALRSWLLETAVPLAPWTLLAFPGMWLLRLGLDFWGTWSGMRTWLVDMIPYAPGRTKAQDDAHEARKQADQAAQVAELAEQKAAGRIAKAERERDEAITAAREDAAEQIERVRAEFGERLEAAEQAAAEREAEQQQRHAERVAALEAELTELREQSGSDVREVRAQAERKLAELVDQHRSDLAAERERAEQDRADLERRLRGELSTVQREADRFHEQVEALDKQRRALESELDAMREAAPSKQRVRWLYQQMGRKGDPRYGRREHVREVARELLEPAGMSQNSVGTAVGYLTAYLDELDEQGPAVNGHRLAGV